MDNGQILSWVVVIIGLVGFRLVGKKVWWAWYVNLGCQILWWIYAVVTGQPAFLVSAAVYSGTFAVNAYEWTKEHRAVKKVLAEMNANKNGTITLPSGVVATYSTVEEKSNN
jgi:hypothetical protein